MTDVINGTFAFLLYFYYNRVHYCVNQNYLTLCTPFINPFSGFPLMYGERGEKYGQRDLVRIS